MGASRLKPLTVKEIQKLTATPPPTIKHRSLGGVPGFVLVHTPAGYTGYGLIYRAGGERKKLTLGSTKMLSLGEARKLAGQYRAKVEAGYDPHGERLVKRRKELEQRRLEEQRLKLDVEQMYAKYMDLVGSQLRSRREKERIFRTYMVARGWPDDAILARIRRAKREACEHAGETYNWPKDLQTIQEWIDSAREKQFGSRRSKSKPSHGELANFVVAKYGSVIRRDRGRRDWCVYNGKFWEEGATEEVKTLIRSCLPDEQVFKGTIDGVEGVMRLYPELSVDPDRWDADKHMLNCPDGTYDLRSGERHDHDPGNHITKMARVSPRFDYQGSRWLSALDTWFGGDPVEIEYIQTLFGLFLTGETRDECVAMWIGKSGAGKTKMTDIMGYIMGDYAQTATDTAFLEVRYHPHQEEVARMRGKRLVFIHEVEGSRGSPRAA